MVNELSVFELLRFDCILVDSPLFRVNISLISHLLTHRRPNTTSDCDGWPDMTVEPITTSRYFKRFYIVVWLLVTSILTIWDSSENEPSNVRPAKTRFCSNQPAQSEDISSASTHKICFGPKVINPASILRKSTSSRYRPVSYPDGPITVRCRFM